MRINGFQLDNQHVHIKYVAQAGPGPTRRSQMFFDRIHE
jgi:hypothetical protein